MLQGLPVIVEDTDRRSYHFHFREFNGALRRLCTSLSLRKCRKDSTAPRCMHTASFSGQGIPGIFESVDGLSKYEIKAAQDSGYRISSLANPNGAKFLNKYGMI
jgi:hypothetical protein